MQLQSDQKSRQSEQEQKIKQTIKVLLRCRPQLKSEVDSENIVSSDQQTNNIIVTHSSHLIQQKFDKVFGEECNQTDVFAEIHPVLKQVLNGYNMTIFAYGQTGSGKTYTMFGQDWETVVQPYYKSKNIKVKEQQTFFDQLEDDVNYAGVIPRTIYNLFKDISENDGQYNVYCSFLQIYNEKIYDLLSDSQKVCALQIHETKFDGLFVEGLLEFNVSNYNETLDLMKRGEKNRAIRSTVMNAKSSRSHTIFQILLESKNADKEGMISRAKVNLCDLAGSEKINKQEKMSSDHFDELKNINQSLTTLGKVIHNLSHGNKLPIAYRESKLTRILWDSLGGNTQTIIIANISPCLINIEETVSTLKFSERARHIKQRVVANKINTKDDVVVNKLQREIQYLKDLLNMRRKGAAELDAHSKYLKLQEENMKLKKTHVSLKQVQELITQNRNLKLEIQKIHQQQQNNPSSPMDDLDSATKIASKISNYNDFPNKKEPLLPSINNQARSVEMQKVSSTYNSFGKGRLTSNNLSNNQNPAPVTAPVNFAKTQTNKHEKNLYQKNLNFQSQIDKSLKSTPQYYHNANISHHLNPVNARVKGKASNQYDLHKQIELNEQNKLERRKKDKQRIIQRLQDLDRLQKNNQIKLENDLKLLEQQNNKTQPQKMQGKKSSVNNLTDQQKQQFKLMQFEDRLKRMEKQLIDQKI